MSCKNCSWYQLGVCDAPILIKLNCYVWILNGGNHNGGNHNG